MCIAVQLERLTLIVVARQHSIRFVCNSKLPPLALKSFRFGYKGIKQKR